MRPAMVCNTCNVDFSDEAAQKSHYRTEWHQYNLRRKVAGVPGITENLYNLRVEALAAEKRKHEGDQSLVYKCSLCSKEYRSSKAHAQHLTSKQHIHKVVGHPNMPADKITEIRQTSERLSHSDREQKMPMMKAREDDSSDEWEEIDGDEDMVESGSLDNSEDEENGNPSLGLWDITQCFFCDLIADGTVEGCVEHMHKQHGFFIPDAEYLKDPRGLLSYLGLKVTKGLMCLYCDEKGKQFQSLEAVRKHMISKSHCKLHYSAEDMEELGDFYDFSSSGETEEASSQMVVAETTPISLTSSSSELMIRQSISSKKSNKIIGSREFAVYYKQQPRPSENRDSALANMLVARYRSMGLATRQQAHKQASNLKESRRLPQFQAESMRTKLALKNNVIRNLPKNVTY